MRLTVRDLWAVERCAMFVKYPGNKEIAGLVPLTTGSVAEFYIDPMLSCVGDIDVMYHPRNRLAIPRGHRPPTQLPAEFHNYVQVFEIHSHSCPPGYVYLRFRYLLTQCPGGGKYVCFESDARPSLVLQRHMTGFTNHGPAARADFSFLSPYCMSVDAVGCIRCMSWPPQAADWLTRHRNYGWPDAATLDPIVNNGCDVVRVAHRQCRQDKWMGKRQFRLSFSRAEIVLINSWMPVQQIVYHLLRYFIKTERLTDYADNSGAGTLSNYHIKTLMLWACELKPRSWWTEKLNLARICVELLNTLSVWLRDIRCPHYFISNCNLIDNSFNVRSAACKLMSIDETYLSTWFVNNYIGQCAQLCPRNVSRFFNDVNTSMKLQNAVSEIVRWRVNNSLHDKLFVVQLADFGILMTIYFVALPHCTIIYLLDE